MATELEQLQERIATAKTSITKAETISEEIEKEWQETLGTSDVEEVTKQLDAMEKKLAELSKQYDKDIADARAILDGVEL